MPRGVDLGFRRVVYSDFLFTSDFLVVSYRPDSGAGERSGLLSWLPEPVGEEPRASYYTCVT